MNDFLAGTTILEFGGGAAGPVATRYFADHGATVIRVESRQRPDFLRILKLTPDTPGGSTAGSTSPCSTRTSSRSRSTSRSPRASAWRDGSRSRVDVVAENFAPGAMAKWGLDYASLVRERPDLVMISTCLNGQTGPQRFYPGFGGQGSALSGFNHLTGWPDREPLGPFGTITDSLSPRFAALLLATALLHRAPHRPGPAHRPVAGGGRHRLPQREHRHLHRERRGPRPHRQPLAARRAARRLPCADEDGRERWIAIASTTTRTGSASSRRSARRPGRVDPELANAGRPPRARRRARAAGSPSGRARSARRRSPSASSRGRRRGARSRTCGDLHDDPQLAHRGHFRTVEHPVLGAHPRRDPRHPLLRHGAARCAVPRRGSDEHTDAVLRDLLDMPADEIARLRAAGALE